MLLYHLTPVRMGKIKVRKDNRCKDEGNMESSWIIDGNKDWKSL